MESTPSDVVKGKLWPDFYAILNAGPDAESKVLRQSINQLYQHANENYDHRDMSRRFYFQVLSQKVLPQCRRILLDPSTRAAYDAQWHLHREAAANALSYPDFLRHLMSTNPNIDANQLYLTDDEIQILPSLQNSAQTPQTLETTPAPTGTPAPTPSEAKPVPVAEKAVYATILPVAKSSSPVVAKKPSYVMLGALGLIVVSGAASAIIRSQIPESPETEAATLPKQSANASAPAKATSPFPVSLPLESRPEIVPSGRGGQTPMWRYTTTAPKGFWASPSFNDSAWKSGAAGFGDGTNGAAVVRTAWKTPQIWVRRSVTFPAKLPAKLAFTCRRDETATIYINGVMAVDAVGFDDNYVDMPLSPAARAAIRPGKNVIAATCKQFSGSQYLDIGIVAAS